MSSKNRSIFGSCKQLNHHEKELLLQEQAHMLEQKHIQQQFQLLHKQELEQLQLVQNQEKVVQEKLQLVKKQDLIQKKKHIQEQLQLMQMQEQKKIKLEACAAGAEARESCTGAIAAGEKAKSNARARARANSGVIADDTGACLSIDADTGISAVSGLYAGSSNSSTRKKKFKEFRRKSASGADANLENFDPKEKFVILMNKFS